LLPSEDHAPIMVDRPQLAHSGLGLECRRTLSPAGDIVKPNTRRGAGASVSFALRARQRIAESVLCRE
jgi:hypothetical protein